MLACGARPLPLQNFRGSYLVGQDVVAALRAELAAQGLHATVPAIMNDTVATLVGAQGLTRGSRCMSGSWGVNGWLGVPGKRTRENACGMHCLPLSSCLPDTCLPSSRRLPACLPASMPSCLTA